MHAPASRAARVIARCRELAEVTDVPGQTTRLFLSPATRDAHTLVGWWMRQAGMEVRIDDVGNVRGLRRSIDGDAPTLLLFSHLDTVPNAGAFDGTLGVLLGIAAVEELAGVPLPFHIEVIGFSEEEGIRFGIPFLSSRATTSTLDDTDLDRRDAQAHSLRDAIRSFGFDPERIPHSCRLRADTRAAIEVHIEQGPALESAGVPLGVVDAVIGQSRLQVSFAGQANHAGTTPMPLRQDALVAAAHWITEVERFALEYKQLVATVGQVDVAPGAVNVVPGAATLSLDVRHPSDASRHAAVARLVTRAEQIGSTRGIKVSLRVLSEQSTVALSPALTEGVELAAERTGYRVQRMYSGAGHDAMILAPHLPTALLFVRSPGGLSHHPDESVHEQDAEAALATLLETIDRLQL